MGTSVLPVEQRFLNLFNVKFEKPVKPKPQAGSTRDPGLRGLDTPLGAPLECGVLLVCASGDSGFTSMSQVVSASLELGWKSWPASECLLSTLVLSALRNPEPR